VEAAPVLNGRDSKDEPAETETNLHWFFQWDQVSTQEKEKADEPLLVRAISGAEVVSLPPRSGEQASALKQRICEAEGTAVFMQQLVQEGRLLNDRDIVGREPLVLVRMPRKRILLASLHFDICPYDLETGSTMRMVSSQSLRLSCMVADWENARCFSGSNDGAVRVWDTHSTKCLGSLPELRGRVTAIVSDQQNHLIAASKAGTIRIWEILEKGSGEVIAKTTQEWNVEVSGKVTMSVDWERSTALLSGDNDQFQSVIMAYDLRTKSSKPLWTCRIPGTTPVLLGNWTANTYMIAPGHQFLEIRSMDVVNQKGTKQFAHQRLHRSGLVNVDWASDRVMFVSVPFGLELWSLSTFEMLHCFRDWSGDNAEVVSLDVDWSQEVPRAITCRTMIDWELVAGEVRIQTWDIQEKGDNQSIIADHPMIGGFDVVAAVAQF
jgi:WD40 repeat protein